MTHYRYNSDKHKACKAGVICKDVELAEIGHATCLICRRVLKNIEIEDADEAREDMAEEDILMAGMIAWLHFIRRFERVE